MRLNLDRAYTNRCRHSTWSVLVCSVVFLTTVQTALCDQMKIVAAKISISYMDPENPGELAAFSGEFGRYGMDSKMVAEEGQVVHVLTGEGTNDGCSPLTNVPPHQGKWIALIERGGCKFSTKIHNAGVLHNATAVVVYNHRDEEDLITMEHNIDHIVSVFVSRMHGEAIAKIVDNDIKVNMNITPGEITVFKFGEGTAAASPKVLIISVSFVVMLSIGLTALLVYAIRRAEYVRSKNTNPMAMDFSSRQETVQESLLDNTSASIDMPDTPQQSVREPARHI